MWADISNRYESDTRRALYQGDELSIFSSGITKGIPPFNKPSVTLRGSPDVVLFTEVCSSGFGRYAGTYRIASELRDNGYIVQVVEYFTKWSTYELMSIIRKFVTKDCLWVGVSTTFLSPDTHRKRKDVLEAPTSVTGRDDLSLIHI